MKEYTRENIIEGLDAKLDEIKAIDPEYDGWCESYRDSIKNYPIEVEQNVLEWINNKPLTDIDCHGASIKKIMDAFNLPNWYFPAILDNFVAFKENNFQGGTHICYEGL